MHLQSSAVVHGCSRGFVVIPEQYEASKVLYPVFVTEHQTMLSAV